MPTPERNGASDKQLVVVLGAGRSGTSLTAGVFNRLGFWIPQPEVQPNETNPRGFGEPRRIVNFHAKLMARQDLTLFDARPAAFDIARSVIDEAADAKFLRWWLRREFKSHDRVVVKDPRTGWFLPLWARCTGMAVTGYVFPLRHPTEVLASVRTTAFAKHTEATRAAWWVSMMLETERLTRTSHRAYLAYDGLLTDWRAEMGYVEAALGMPVLSQADDAARTAVDELVDPSLRRAARGWDGVEVPEVVHTLAEQVWQHLLAMTRPGGDDAERRAALDELRERYVALYTAAEAIADSSIYAATRETEQVVREQERARRRARRPHRRAGRLVKRLVLPTPSEGDAGEAAALPGGPVAPATDATAAGRASTPTGVAAGKTTTAS